MFIHHQVTEVVLLALIVLSIGLMLLELVVSPGWFDLVVFAGEGITLIFVLELVIRFWVAPRKSRFFTRYWLDILAVIPVIRPLRIFRLLRVLRLFRAGVLLNRRVSTLDGAFSGTLPELVSLFVGTATVVITGAMVLFFVEGGDDAPLGSFTDVLWFATFSLVAGEPIGAEPTTEIGRWTTLFLMVGGLSIFGMFVGTVSATMVSRLSMKLEIHEMDLDELTDHVILLGWNGSAPTVLRELFGMRAPPGRAVVLVTELPEPPKDLPTGIPRERLYYVHGDYTLIEVLERVGVRRAARAVILADECIPRSHQDRDARSVLAALTIERMAPTVYSVVELYSRQSEDLLRMAGVEEIVVGDWYAGMIIGAVSRNRGLVSVLDEALTGQHGSTFHTLYVPPRLDGRSVAEMHQILYQQHRAILVSVDTSRGEERVTVVNPEPDHRVRSGDRLVVLSPGEVSL